VQRQAHLDHARAGLELEAELARQVLHARVLAQGFAAQHADAALAGAVDQAFHQAPAEAAALDVGGDEDGELGRRVVRVGHHARLAQRTFDAVGVALDGHQGNLAVVVDLGKARQLRTRQLAHGAEEAHARILRVERGDQVGQRGFVLRPDRPDQQLAAMPVDMCCSSSLG
jgi:hypothetical protein